jgi:hypothetical protein
MPKWRPAQKASSPIPPHRVSRNTGGALVPSRTVHAVLAASAGQPRSSISARSEGPAPRKELFPGSWDRGSHVEEPRGSDETVSLNPPGICFEETT